MAGTVWTKFYWSDWNSDPALRICSLAAQGLWMRLLCVAAESEPVGYVSVNGRALDLADIARMTGATETECNTLLEELAQRGVFSRDRRGMIYSRRMVRDTKKQKKARENGKKGGNPTLRSFKDNAASDNPTDKATVMARHNTHMPEARNQKPEEERARMALTKEHRLLVTDLLDRGKTSLTAWERNFLEGMLGRAEITAKASIHLDAIAAKIGITIKEVMETWGKRMVAARTHGQWDTKWGPMPGQLGCRAPDQLLQEGDGRGWTIWKPDEPLTLPTGQGGTEYPEKTSGRPRPTLRRPREGARNPADGRIGA